MRGLKDNFLDKIITTLRLGQDKSYFPSKKMLGCPTIITWGCQTIITWGALSQNITISNIIHFITSDSSEYSI